MHLLQEHFPALAAVSGNMVARWAHANEVPARPRRGLLHFVTPDTDAGRYIIELAMSARDTWEEMRALLVVRRRALCARSATKCVLTPQPFPPLSLPLARALSLSLSLSQHRQRTFCRNASRIWAPCRGTWWQYGRTRMACLRDRTAVFFTSSRRVQMRACTSSSWRGTRGTRGRRLRLSSWCVAERFARALQLSACSHLNPFSPCLSHSRARSLSLSSRRRQCTCCRRASRIWAPCRGAWWLDGRTRTRCRRDRGAVFFTSSRRVQRRASLSSSWRRSRGTRGIRLRLSSWCVTERALRN